MNKNKDLIVNICIKEFDSIFFNNFLKLRIPSMSKSFLLFICQSIKS